MIMRNCKLLTAAAVLVAAMLSLAVDCPPTGTVDPNDYALDPNLINFKLMCVIDAVEGDVIDKELLACDPDDDNAGFVFTLANAPFGMTVVETGGAWRLLWPASVGVFYVDVTVTDIPIGGDSLTDRGSVVFRIFRKNKPPVLGGCR